LETESNASSEVIGGKAIGSLAAPTLKMKKQPSLPSHLPALSTISNTGQQWTGRAVKLRLAPPPSTQSFAKSANPVTATAAAKPSPAAPAQACFELTNDMGIAWLSTDGQTWKHE
jgi:hypothetical protein